MYLVPASVNIFYTKVLPPLLLSSLSLSLAPSLSPPPPPVVCSFRLLLLLLSLLALFTAVPVQLIGDNGKGAAALSHCLRDGGLETTVVAVPVTSIIIDDGIRQELEGGKRSNRVGGDICASAVTCKLQRLAL